MRIVAEYYLPRSRADRLEHQGENSVHIDLVGFASVEQNMDIPKIDLKTFFALGGEAIIYDPDKEPGKRARYGASGSFASVHYAVEQWKCYTEVNEL